MEETKNANGDLEDKNFLKLYEYFYQRDSNYQNCYVKRYNYNFTSLCDCKRYVFYIIDLESKKYSLTFSP